MLDWDFQNAVRELIQNGVDQAAVNPQCKFSIEYNFDKKSIIYGAVYEAWYCNRYIERKH